MRRLRLWNSQCELSFYRFLARVPRALVFPSRLASWVLCTAVGVAVAFALEKSGVLNQLASPRSDMLNALVGIGALIGTMFTLVVSLSMLPVQSASERVTPLVVRLFARDSTSAAIVALLACLCVVVVGLGFASSTVASLATRVAPAILGLTLDLIRWHGRRMAKLLDPVEGLRVVTRLCEKIIQRFQRRVAASARMMRRVQYPGRVPPERPATLETALYLLDKTHAPTISRFVVDVAETTLKAIDRGDLTTAIAGVTGIFSIGRSYVEARRGNAIAIPQARTLFMVATADTDDVVTPVQEHLADIGKRAVVRFTQAVAIEVVKALASLSDALARAVPSRFGVRDLLHPRAPIYHLRQVVASAIDTGLYDVALEASHSLRELAVRTPRDALFETAFDTILMAWSEIVAKLLGGGNATLAREVWMDQADLVADLLEQESPHYTHVLKECLERLPARVPQEGAALSASVPWYDSIDRRHSFGGLLSTIGAQFARKPPGACWRNWLQTSSIISEHVLALAPVGIGDGMVLHLAGTYSRIVAAHRRLVDTVDYRPHAEKIREDIGRLVHGFSLLISREDVVTFVENACEAIADGALILGEVDHLGAWDTAVAALEDVARSRIARCPDQWIAAGLLMHLYKLQMLAALEGKTDRAAAMTAAIKRSEHACGNRDLWPTYGEAVQTEVEQLDERLGRNDWMTPTSRLEAALRALRHKKA